MNGRSSDSNILFTIGWNGMAKTQARRHLPRSPQNCCLRRCEHTMENAPSTRVFSGLSFAHKEYISPQHAADVVTRRCSARQGRYTACHKFPRSHMVSQASASLGAYVHTSVDFGWYLGKMLVRQNPIFSMFCHITKERVWEPAVLIITFQSTMRIVEREA